ncbi:hypothetical protein BST61_g928 [Cercospora zeina]
MRRQGSDTGSCQPTGHCAQSLLRLHLRLSIIVMVAVIQGAQEETDLVYRHPTKLECKSKSDRDPSDAKGTDGAHFVLRDARRLSVGRE